MRGAVWMTMGWTCAAAVAAIAVACGSAGDAMTAAPAGVDASGTSDANGSSGSDGSTGDASPSGDGGDGGSDAGTGSGNAFTDAPPYTPMLGISTLRAEHQSAFGTQDPSKHDCSDCHLFAAAGSVFTDATGTTPVAMAEVRLRTASTGKAVSVYTDANGNFIVEQSTAFLAGLQFPFQGGVRTDAGIALMIGTQNDGSCNMAACHGGAQGWVHGP